MPHKSSGCCGGGCLLLAAIPWPHGSRRRVSRKHRAAGRPLRLRPWLCILPHPWFPFGAGIKAGQAGSAGAAAGMAARSLAVFGVVLDVFLVLTAATNPGFVVRITQAGLDYGGFGS